MEGWARALRLAASGPIADDAMISEELAQRAIETFMSVTAGRWPRPKFEILDEDLCFRYVFPKMLRRCKYAPMNA